METTITSVAAIPEATAQEWVSVAFVEAIAAQSGLNIKNCRWDDGVDIEIGSNKKLPCFPNIANLYLSFQLKSTSIWSIKNGHIHYPLKASNYTKLRNPNSFTSQYLILYTLPHSRSKWITHVDQRSEFRHQAYFMNLLNAPELKPRADGRPRTTRTVRVPIANRLTATSLLRLYRDSCNTYAKMRGGA